MLRNAGRVASGMPVAIPSESRSPSQRNRGHLGPEYARYRAKIGVDGVQFHSFRHTVADELKQNGVPIMVIEDILGHQNSSISANRYSQQYAASTMLQALEKLDFSDVLP